MGWYTTSARQEIYRKYPKIELHRHLEGALRIETLLEVARKYGITVPVRPELQRLVQVQQGEELNFRNFLSKFQVLRLFYRTAEVIRRVTREAIEDAAADGVQYMELRFTPVALSRSQNFPLGEVMDWVCESARQASQSTGLPTRLIASVNRHEDPSLAEKVAGLAAERIPKGIVGLDLAGNEADFSAQPFVEIFKQARAGGLFISAHAGEWGGAYNVREAIEVLEADRIAHGVRVVEDPRVVGLARERGTAFEVCLTSNFHTGVVASLDSHPLPRMLDAGLNVTLNTDDPSISGITLSDEYRLAVETFGLSEAELAGRVLAASRAAFLAPAEKQALVERFTNQLADHKLN